MQSRWSALDATMGLPPPIKVPRAPTRLRRVEHVHASHHSAAARPVGPYYPTLVLQFALHEMCDAAGRSPIIHRVRQTRSLRYKYV